MGTAFKHDRIVLFLLSVSGGALDVISTEQYCINLVYDGVPLA